MTALSPGPVAAESPAVVIAWAGSDSAARTWSPDESRALRGEAPKPIVPVKRQVDQVRPRHFAPAGASSLRPRDVPAWFEAMDRWTKRQRAEFSTHASATFTEMVAAPWFARAASGTPALAVNETSKARVGLASGVVSLGA